MFDFKKSITTNWYALAVVFCISVLVFGYVHLNYTTADPDAFYHAKMALMLRDQGVFTEFPWLSATALSNSFADHHFLYHIALIPFVSTPLPLVGLKLATILFASLAVAGFGWLLAQLKVRGSYWYALLLLAVGPFVFRLGLMKAQGLALFVLWIALYFVYQRKYIPLLITTFIYVWVYGGWPLLLVLSGIWLVAGGVWAIKHHGLIPVRFVQTSWIRSASKIVAVLGCGVLAGLVFSPYFPHNLQFYWQQIVSIALVNYQHVIGVGGEWYPYELPSLLNDAPVLFGTWAIGILGLCAGFKKQSAQSWTWFLYALVFVVLTAKSRRNVEYLAPMIIGFTAISMNALVPSIEVWLKRRGAATFIKWLPIAICVGLLPFAVQEIDSVKRQYDSGQSLGALRGPAQWLAAYAPQNSIVMHSDWDDFPVLWYYNSHQRYIVGLDPTFLYLHSPQQSKLWVAITTGELTKNLVETIRGGFGATYAIIGDTDHQKFDDALAADPLANLVYSDEQSKIYELRAE